MKEIDPLRRDENKYVYAKGLARKKMEEDPALLPTQVLLSKTPTFFGVYSNLQEGIPTAHVYPSLPENATVLLLYLMDYRNMYVEGTSMALLLPPESLGEERDYMASSVRVRNEIMMDRWGPDLVRLQFKCRTAGFFVESGLTSGDRHHSTAYKNLQALFELYRNNSMQCYTEDTLTINQVGRVHMIFGHRRWIGRFDSFSITEARPYTLDFTFSFVVYQDLTPRVTSLPPEFYLFDSEKIIPSPESLIRRPKEPVGMLKPADPKAVAERNKAREEQAASSPTESATAVNPNAPTGSGTSTSTDTAKGKGSVEKKASDYSYNPKSIPGTADRSNLKELVPTPGKFIRGRPVVELIFTEKAYNGLVALQEKRGQVFSIFSGTEGSPGSKGKSTHSTANTQHWRNAAVDITHLNGKAANRHTKEEMDRFLLDCFECGAGCAQFEETKKKDKRKGSGHFHVDWGPPRGADRRRLVKA